MRRTHPVAALAAITALCLVAAGCGGTSSSTTGNDDTYTIGYITDVTGSQIATAVPRAQAARLAVEDINRTNFLGAGKKLAMTEQDGKAETAPSISAANKLLTDDDVLAVVCCSLSSVAGALKPLFLQAKTPLVATTAVMPGLPEPPYIYRTALLNNTADGGNGQLAQKAATVFQPDDVVIVRTSDNDGMRSEAKVWKSVFDKNGVDVKIVDTGAKDTDFNGPATQVAALDPDLVADSMLGSTAAPFIRALRERGYTGQILGNVVMGNERYYKVAGDAFTDMIYAVPFSPLTDNDAATSFIDEYTAKYDEAPTNAAAQGYVAVYLIANALKRAGDNPTRKSVGQALSEITSFDSVVGPITMKDGQAYGADFVFVRWTADGKQELWEPGG